MDLRWAMFVQRKDSTKQLNLVAWRWMREVAHLYTCIGNWKLNCNELTRYDKAQCHRDFHNQQMSQQLLTNCWHKYQHTRLMLQNIPCKNFGSLNCLNHQGCSLFHQQRVVQLRRLCSHYM